MINISRLKKIQEKLGLRKDIPVQYMVGLVVYKDKTFEESQNPPGGFNNVWCNGRMNAVRGKKYLGQFTYEEKPKVTEKLKQIYVQAQENIQDNLNAAMALVWVFLRENDKGEVILKNRDY